MAGSKTSVVEVVREHYRTFYDARTGKPRWQDYVMPVAVPLVAAAVSAALGWRMSSAATLTNGLAILTGLLFALVVFVFQLRLDVTRDPRHEGQLSLRTRIDELFQNVLYAILVGLTATVLSVIADAATSTDGQVSRWWTAVMIAVGGHAVATVLQCLKRTLRAYRALNG